MAGLTGVPCAKPLRGLLKAAFGDLSKPFEGLGGFLFGGLSLFMK